MPEADPAKLMSDMVAAEQRARELLASGQWRKARDEIKPLVKLDRARYLPLLIQANIGLSREMQAKGQVAEAQQVLSYLASIASADEMRAAEAQLTGNKQPAASDLTKALTDPGVTEAEKLRLADRLVISFQPLTGEEPSLTSVAAELQAVHDGLLALSMGQWEQLPEILRRIPHRSVLAHWTMFIKGVAAFHTQEHAKAVRFLTSLPPDTIPAKASQSYLLFVRPSELLTDRPPLTAPVLEGAGRLLGQPNVGRLLLEADKLWTKQRQYAESYRVLRKALPNFPSLGVDSLGALTDFYFNAAHTLPDRQREEFTDYFDRTRNCLEVKSRVEELLIYRMFALGGQDREEWEGFLKLREQLRGPNPRFASMLYTDLAARLAQADHSIPFFFDPDPGPSDPKGARDCLRKAIDLDPDNLDAHLILAKLYEILGQRSELNRLRDQMVQRFPEEKRVLISAASGCLERDAFVKGLDYLDRARGLDQLDPQIPQLIVSARRKLALQYFEQRRTEKARQCLALAEEYLNDKRDDFYLSRWTARLRQGLMEQQWGDPARGQALLTEARAASPSAIAFLLFGHLAQRSTTPDIGKRTQFWPELTAELKRAPEVAEAVLLLRMLNAWRASIPELGTEEGVLRKYVKAAAQRPFTRDQARQLIELRLEDPGWRTELRAVIKKVLRTDALDPLFRLYQLLMETQQGYPFANRMMMESLLDEAARRGDESTAQRIRQLLKRAESPPPMPMPPFGLDFDDDDDEDQEELEFADPSLNGLLPDIPPGDKAELAQLLELLRGMSKGERRRARQNRPRGMPAEVFDMLMDLAESGEFPPMPPPFPPRPGPRR